MPAAPLLLCASPRTGNSLEAARLFAAGFNASRVAETPELQPTLLSTCNVLPCLDCGACLQGLPCPLLTRDDSAALLNAFVNAPFVAICSPIYFYHLPGQLKILLDRCQQYYAWSELGLGKLENMPGRKAFVMLCAARERGGQLFKGSLLTLKFALAPFNLNLKTPLLMRGLDQAGDLARRPDYHAALKHYGAMAAKLASTPWKPA